MIDLKALKINLPFFILASGSPQRKWILEQLKLDFKIEPPGIDENLDNIPLKKPYAIVKHLALAKAQIISDKYPNTPVLSCDTLVVSREGEILGKPKGKKEAKQMLESYNGSYADIYSGLAWIHPQQDKPFLGYDKTRLYFKLVSTKAMDDYLRDEEWKYCSGGMKIEKIEAWIRKRVGEYWNVVGLPLTLLQSLVTLKSPKNN